ncbi:hypothetical protein ACIQ9P_07145 [Kitasatospora sp. NPDC094019]|uniref:hypothetical protein n=1 Tax=Kitasatospora sp. NPDC094019 TaxID=3364091 RepID=UPI00380568E2
MKISREKAVELVSALLAENRGNGPELAVIGINPTPVGWVVAWNSARYALDPRTANLLVGGGPYLVDGDDGSVFRIPGETFRVYDWQAMFRERFKGVGPPDALLESVRELALSDGRLAALRLLRKEAPSLDIARAREYVGAVMEGREPPAETLAATRKVESFSPLPIERISGPVE